MASTRMCLACNRPNGLHFSRCISCGGWVGAASSDEGGPVDTADASFRAVRLLEGLTPERRKLLPEEFLRSLQKQARGVEDVRGESGAHRARSIPQSAPRPRPDGLMDPSLDGSLETPIPLSGEAPRASEEIALPPVGHASDDGLVAIGEEPYIAPAILPAAPEDLPTEDMFSIPDDCRDLLDDVEWGEGFHSSPHGEDSSVDPSQDVSVETPLAPSDQMTEDQEAPPAFPWTAEAEAEAEAENSSYPHPSEEAESPPAHHGLGDGPGPLWENPYSRPTISAVAPEDLPAEEVFPVLDDRQEVLGDTEWVEEGSDSSSHEEVEGQQSALMQSLVSGRGPFGDRDERFRLFLLPDLAYAATEQSLRIALAEIMDVNLYTAGLWLKKSTPTLIAAGEDPRELDKRVLALRVSGLEVLLVERGYWLDGILPISVRSIGGATPGPVTFLLERGEVESVPRERFGYCVLGDVDLPGGRNVFILDLYLADAPVCLRVRSDRFDFSVLGPLAEGPTAGLMHRLVHWLSLNPAVPLPLDEAFQLVPGTSRSMKSSGTAIEPAVVDFSEYSLLCDQGRRGE